MKINLPNSAWIGNIDSFLRSFDTKNDKILEVTSHEKWISVHPLVLCMITALGMSVRLKGGKIDFEEMEARSKHYFERMGLFEHLNLISEIHIKKHEPSGRFIPISIINDSKKLQRFITEMIPLLHLNPSQVEPLKYVISELVRNVFEHSNSKIGAVVCAQYYKKSNTVRIGVVDCGIGIRESLSRSYKTEDDIQAIGLALTPGITGKTRKIGGTEQNAGAGLFFIKSIAKVNRDFFMAYSGRGMYKLLKTPPSKSIKLNMNPFKDNCSKDNGYPYWQGTIVGIDISLDRNQKFDILLDLISKTYRKDIKERKKKLFKRVRFI